MRRLLKGEKITKVNLPESFNVLVRELKGLWLEVELLPKTIKALCVGGRSAGEEQRGRTTREIR